MILLRRSNFRAEWIATLAIVLSFFLLVTASAQWWGGWSAGPRYLVPMLPFFVWPLVAAFETLRKEVESKLRAIQEEADRQSGWKESLF